MSLKSARRAILTCLAGASGIVATAVISVPSARVAAQGGDSLVRPWSCLVSSAASGSIFSTTINPACGAIGKTGRLPLGGRVAAADVVAPPGPPSSLGATVSGQTVVLAWNVSSAGGAPTAYVLQVGSSPGSSNVVVSSVGLTTSLTADGVPPGTYYARVVATNASGTSAPSNEVIVAVGSGGGGGTSCNLAPAVPTGLTTSSSGSNITISWQRPPVGCPPTSYILQAGSAPGLSNLANFNTGSDSTAFSAGGVGAGTYYIRVIAVNAGGASGPSQDVALVVGGGSCSGAPGAPTSFLASVSGSTVTFAWQAAPGSPSTYVLLAGTSAGATNAGQFDLGNGLSYTAAGVPSGTYYVRLQARNTCGAGPVSNEVVITVGGSGGGGGAPAGPGFATLHGFAGSPNDGSNWSTVTQGSDGNLYGTAATGGPFNPACATNLTGCGMLYRLSPSGAFTVLYNFEGTTADHRQTPIYPYGALLQASDGNFYGTTSEGASVYRMTPGGSVTTITFLGGGSYADLIQGQDGNLYGTTALGGEGTCPADRSALCHPTPGEGTVFRVSLSGGLTTLKVFSGGADGARPYGGLVIGPDGAFYGTTRGGGAGQGTVFRITSSGAFSTIHTFDGSDGSFPYSRLTVGGDGNLYGATTNGGGGANAGVVFKVSPGGVFTVLHVFTGFSVPDPSPRPGVPLDGAYPAAPLVAAADGTFIGVSASGGAYAGGTVFKISPAGGYAQLFTFAGNAEGSSPIWLMRGGDGGIYGNCQYGGARNMGAIFKITGL
ncbi:MAG TPA: choice-of-anchor tandem repeat GloVer-containing protein [Vicinamibacterales bacterium]|nr:choice-of-anchor tandem repeat GloVer-containing protein [Vicinamibacterales bacterium]